MAMARGAYFFWNFQGGDSCTLIFLQASVDFQKIYGGHLEGSLHGELYVFSSRDKFQLRHLDRVESCPGMKSSM